MCASGRMDKFTFQVSTKKNPYQVGHEDCIFIKIHLKSLMIDLDSICDAETKGEGREEEKGMCM